MKKGEFGGNAAITPKTPPTSTMSTDALFSGQSDYALDEKGRLTVQRDWRVKGVDSETLHLVPDSKGTCLRVMRPDRFAKFAETVEKVCVDLVEAGKMTKDLARSLHSELEPPKDSWLPTEPFLDVLASNLKAKLQK